MIEKMIVRFKSHLPVKIEKVSWDGDYLIIAGTNWGFATLSAWRMSTNDRVNFGCEDYENVNDLPFLVGLEIVDVGIQTDQIKIDPIFHLSNGHTLEIFSTDTFEPWTFRFGEPMQFYSAVPADPSLFDVRDT